MNASLRLVMGNLRGDLETTSFLLSLEAVNAHGENAAFARRAERRGIG